MSNDFVLFNININIKYYINSNLNINNRLWYIVNKKYL